MTGQEIKDIAARVREGQTYLATLKADEIIGRLGEVCKRWSDRNSSVQKRFGAQGINFLLYWFRETHLQQAMDVALRGDRHVLDDFQKLPGMPYQVIAQPRGLICHWLAGNVPMLGMLSLAQGLLTKNGNILKVAKQNGEVIPALLETFKEVDPRLEQSIAAIYFESGNLEAQRALSSVANVRVAWGGLEAVEAIMNLPRKFGCDDVVFGPKTSFMVIGREMLTNADQARGIARKAASDASLFEQRGCNSPHTVFVESGGAVTPAEFAKLLADEMAETLKRVPKEPVASAETMRILRLRAEYDMRGEAFYSSGTEWTVLFADNDAGLAQPCYNRTLFVRPVDDVMTVEKHCTHLTQSAGTALSPERKREFAKRVTARGIDRCPEIGSMTLYEVPWDGMFVMDRFVRWCKA